MKKSQAKESIAYHEAAHCVIGFVLDGTVPYTLTINLPDGSDTVGECDGEHPIQVGVTAEGIENAIVSLYAGFAAQVEFDPTNEELYKSHASDDDDKADKFLSYLGSDRKELGKKLRDRAKELVQENWSTITAVAEELLLHGTLDDYEAECIMMASRGDEEAKAYLEKYRWHKSQRPPPKNG